MLFAHDFLAAFQAYDEGPIPFTRSNYSLESPYYFFCKTNNAWGCKEGLLFMNSQAFYKS